MYLVTLMTVRVLMLARPKSRVQKPSICEQRVLLSIKVSYTGTESAAVNQGLLQRNRERCCQSRSLKTDGAIGLLEERNPEVSLLL